MIFLEVFPGFVKEGWYVSGSLSLEESLGPEDGALDFPT